MMFAVLTMVHTADSKEQLDNDTEALLTTARKHPVMQSIDEPNFYLKHGFDKSYTDYGCPYVQENCDVFAPSDNLVIYGHHMNDGSMFAALDDYKSKKFWGEHKTITFDTLTQHNEYEIVNQFELHKLLTGLDLGKELNWDWFILLVAKTGMRFSEALAITPNDFDFSKQSLSISKTWDYKGNGGFMPTKNQSSVRKIQIDWQLIIQFSTLVKGLPEDEPIFVNGNVYNSTVNDVLTRHCKNANIPIISVHGLRHTHASLLLFAGVSIASVAQRLGHSSMTTTQKTYLHIIQELENKDVDLVMRSLSSLN